MVEIFTIGGGEYIVNTLNAVAAWTGSGGYKSLLQVVLVMGLAQSALVVAFNQDWRAWIHWYIAATLIYTCLMVPRIEVKVTDRVDPGLSPATVAHVPLGLALVASVTSQASDYLTRSAETVFGLPSDLDYSRNGMIYGARLLEATRTLRIADPEFAANFDEHIRQCVFYDLLLGRYSMKSLAESEDIWSTIAPGSPARAQKLLTRKAGGEVTATIVTCRDAHAVLDAQWAGLIEDTARVAGLQLYPKQTQALAKAKLMADLPVAYHYLTGISKDAGSLFRQVLTINAMSGAMHGFVASGSSSGVDVFAQTRADIQTERTYSSIAHNAMKWVPLLNAVLTIVFYAMFPVLFPLFLLPGGGISALKGYVTGFFYLAAWGPLFVILHMMLMMKGAGDVAAAGATRGLTLATFSGIADVNNDIAVLAGYLVASIPFLAGGIARGALAISGHATSYLNPSQNAAEEAAREASTGNVSLGNANIDNSSVLSRQFAQGNLAPSVAYGSPQARQLGASGAVTSSFPEAEVASIPNSSYPFAPSLGSDFSSRLATLASQSRSQSETLSNLAQQSTSAAVTSFAEIRSAYTRSHSSEVGRGTSTNDTVSNAISEVDNASLNLQQQFGLSRRAADDISVTWFLNGEGSFGLSPGAGRSRTGIGVKGGRNQSWTDSDIGIASQDRSRIIGSLRQIAHNRNWANTREGFVRETETSSNASIASEASGLTTALTQTRSFTREARRAREVASRLESQVGWYSSANAAGALNLSQAYREYGMAEMDANRDYYGLARFDDLAFQTSAHGRQLQQRFLEQYAERLRDSIAGDLVLPDTVTVEAPDIDSWGEVRESLAPLARVPLSEASPDESTTRKKGTTVEDVRRAQHHGERRIDRVRTYLDATTRDARGASAEAADETKKW